METAGVTNYFGGAISGAGGFTQSGVGVTVLTGTNSYTGPTLVSAGTLQLGAGGSTGTVGAGTTITVNSGATLALDFNGASNATPVTVFGTVTGVEAPGVTSVFSGVISGSGGFTQNGLGTTNLSGDNGYTGVTTLNSGTLILSGSINSNSGLVLGGGVLNFAPAGGAGAQAFNNTILNPGLATITNAIAGDTLNLGSVTRNVGGLLNISSLTGTTNLNNAVGASGIAGLRGGRRRRRHFRLYRRHAGCDRRPLHGHLRHHQLHLLRAGDADRQHHRQHPAVHGGRRRPGQQRVCDQLERFDEQRHGPPLRQWQRGH